MDQHEDDADIVEAMALLKAIPEPSTDITARVMQEIRTDPEHRQGAWPSMRLGHLWRTMSIGIGALVAVFGLVTAVQLSRRESAASHTYVATGPSVRMVRFVLVAPDAHDVALTGSFNRWSETSLHRLNSEGTWIVDVPLSTGRYPYMYIVNGQRIPDPAARLDEPSDFGGTNSVITVAAGTEL